MQHIAKKSSPILVQIFNRQILFLAGTACNLNICNPFYRPNHCVNTWGIEVAISAFLEEEN